MLKRTLTVAALATVLAAPAFAQSATTPMNNDKPAAADKMNKPAADANKPAAMDSKPATNAAQSSMPSSATTGTQFVQSQSANEWRGSKLIGASVYGPDNASIGEINDVVLASDGKINAVVIGVGGFLGVGQKDVAIPFNAINVTRKADSASIDKITVSYTKDQLKNAPKFAYYEPASKSTTGASTPMTSPATKR
jgi:hypothetical protein